MKFKVLQQDNKTEEFDLFVDAWLHIYLNLSCFAKIQCPDGDLITINPPKAN